MKARMGMVGAGIMVAAGLSVAFGVAMAQEVNDVKKVAALIKKGDMAGAKKAAAAFNKAEVEEIMNRFKPQKKGGMPIAGSDLGIEQTLNKVERDAPTPAAMDKMKAAYEEMGYNIAAIALITNAVNAPKSPKGTAKDWQKWSSDLADNGIKLAEAAKGNSAAGIKTAATAVNKNCGSCHGAFK